MRRALIAVMLVVTILLAAPVLAERKGDERDRGNRGGIAGGNIDYGVTVDATGATYPWIDATGGTNIPAGDDSLDSIVWPFDFAMYDDLRIGGVDSFDVNSNGSVHTDPGGPRTLWVNCGDIPSNIDGQWVAGLGDDLDPTAGGSVWYIVTGMAPNRILTVEWVDVPEFGGTGQVDVEISFYEGSNKIVTQYREQAPPDYLSDGVVGINAGDAVRGTQVFCAASGELPSRDFDVEYQPECVIQARINRGRTVRDGDPLVVDLNVTHARPRTVTTTVLVEVSDMDGNVVASRRFPRLTFEHLVTTDFGGMISQGLPAGQYRLEVKMGGMAGWKQRHRSLFVVE